MITKPTVFVLGAGASSPYGFPTGTELRDQICFEFKNQHLEWLKRKEANAKRRQLAHERAVHFCDVFYGSTDPSIDFWPAKNPEFLDIGKLAIVFRILEAEAKRQMREKCHDLRLDWSSYLYRRLTSELNAKPDFAKFAENQVDFVTFNYDRSIEQLFFESLTNGFYGTAQDLICQTLAKRAIVHVYGQMARLDWQDPEHGISYGRSLLDIQPEHLANNLYVLYEERENPNIEKAKGLLSRAQRVFFLGFGYAHENLRVLGIPEIFGSDHEIFGTARGSSEEERKAIRSSFTMNPHTGTGSKVRSANVHIEDVDCLALLRKYL
jgi:hypothetical protein